MYPLHSKPRILGRVHVNLLITLPLENTFHREEEGYEVFSLVIVPISKTQSLKSSSADPQALSQLDILTDPPLYSSFRMFLGLSWRKAYTMANIHLRYLKFCVRHTETWTYHWPGFYYSPCRQTNSGLNYSNLQCIVSAILVSTEHWSVINISEYYAFFIPEYC